MNPLGANFIARPYRGVSVHDVDALDEATLLAGIRSRPYTRIGVNVRTSAGKNGRPHSQAQWVRVRSGRGRRGALFDRRAFPGGRDRAAGGRAA